MAGSRLPELFDFDVKDGDELASGKDWKYKTFLRYFQDISGKRLKNGKPLRINIVKAPYGYKYAQFVLASLIYGGNWHIETLTETAISPWRRDIRIWRNGVEWEPPFTKIETLTKWQEAIKKGEFDNGILRALA